MMNIEQTVKQKRKQILEIAAKYGAYNVRLFGSTVRGDATETSDVDFLVQLESRCKLFDWLHLEEDLESLLGKRVDVVQEEAMKGKMRERVLKEAIPL
jgi:predicted nucleotidyltransferase